MTFLNPRALVASMPRNDPYYHHQESATLLIRFATPSMYLKITLDGVAFLGTQGKSAASGLDPLPEGWAASLAPAMFGAL